MEPLHFFKNMNPLGLLCAACLWGGAQAQNLVTNSTFEAKCIKNGYGEIKEANGWTNANDGTVDLFDKKKSARKTSPNAIPYNYMGYQPSSDGQNYAGLVAFYDDGTYCDTSAYRKPNSYVEDKLGLTDGYKRYTEYLEGELREPMVAGMVYEVSFRVNLANNSGRAVSCLGALLTSQKVDQPNNTFLTETPQFITHKIINDTANWIILSGAYIATGGEKFITIGCFKDENFSMEKLVNRYQNDSHKAYYYVSEVSVTPYTSLQPNLDAMLLGVDYVELMNVQFASGSSNVTPQFYNELDEVAKWMTKYPDYKFFIAGYTDQQGGDAINDPLSAARASSVKKYLVSKGVKEDNLITDGFGSSDPIEYKWKSRKNRRVEIYIYTVTKLSQL